MNAEKEKEKILWIQHVTKVSAIGIRNAQVIDLDKGVLPTYDGNYILEKGLLESLKFIKEGEFEEKEGAPTLKIIGEIKGFIDAESSVHSDTIYSLFRKDILKELNISSHDFICLAWKLNLRENSKYHTSVKTGKTGEIHKYSDSVIDYLREHLSDEYIKECKDEYKVEHPIKWNPKRKAKRK